MDNSGFAALPQALQAQPYPGGYQQRHATVEGYGGGVGSARAGTAATGLGPGFGGPARCQPESGGEYHTQKSIFFHAKKNGGMMRLNGREAPGGGTAVPCSADFVVRATTNQSENGFN